MQDDNLSSKLSILDELRRLNKLKALSYQSLYNENNIESNMIVNWVNNCKFIHKTLVKFPRHEKYALSQEIRRRIYDVLELHVDIKFKQYKKTYVEKCRHEIEKLRVNFLVAQQLGYFHITHKDRQEQITKNTYGGMKAYADIMHNLNDVLGIMARYEAECKKIGNW